MSDERCIHEKRIEYIKHRIVTEIFCSGALHDVERFDVMDKEGNVSKEDDELLDEKMMAQIQTYKKIVDIVWDENFDAEFICDECQQELEDEKTVQDIENELKNNHGQGEK